MTERLTAMTSFWATKEVYHISIEDLYRLINSPEVSREKTIDIQRNSNDPEAQQKIKKTLPVFIANGEFSIRNNNAMVDYGKHLVVDFDYPFPLDIDKRDRDWSKLKNDPYTKLLYHTPRGGLKVLLEHSSIDPAHHQDLNESVWKYYENSYQMKADINCSALAHCHFLCYDPEVYFCQSPSVFPYKPQQEPKAFESNMNYSKLKTYDKNKFLACHIRPKPECKSDIEVIEKAISLSDKKFPICKGFRNKNLFKLAILLRDWYVPKDLAEQYLILKYVEPDFLGKEISEIVNSAYK